MSHFVHCLVDKFKQNLSLTFRSYPRRRVSNKISKTNSRLRGHERDMGSWFGYMLIFPPDRSDRILILGFATTPMMAFMYLDMDEIEKLNPRGLHNLRPMMFVVEVISNLIAAQIGKKVENSPIMLKLVRALARYQRQVRDNAAYNLNVKIKAWIMAKAERRAWVRGIIGEAAIRRWQVRYDNLSHPIEVLPKLYKKTRSAPQSEFLPYVWKRFTMADLTWLETKPLTRLNTALSESFSQSGGGWRQMRQRRGFKPVEFYAFELAADYVPSEPTTGVRENPKAGAKKTIHTKPDPPPHQCAGRQNIGSGKTYAQPDEKKPP